MVFPAFIWLRAKVTKSWLKSAYSLKSFQVVTGMCPGMIVSTSFTLAAALAKVEA